MPLLPYDFLDIGVPAPRRSTSLTVVRRKGSGAFVGRPDTRKLISTALVRSYGPMSSTRKWVNRFDSYETRRSRALIRTLRAGRPQVLYLGDSTNYAFRAEGDIRPMVAMLRRELPGTSIYFTGNAGYHLGLWNAYLSLVEQSEVRPVLVALVCARLYTGNWMHHPAYTYAAEARQIAGLSVHDRHVPRTPKGKPPAAAFEDFRNLPCRSLLGEFPIGHYLAQLRREDLTPEEKSRWWYGYLHGSEVAEGPGLQVARDFGATIARLGVPIVLAQTPVCVERGNRLLGPALGELVERNMSLLADTLTAAAGPRCTVLRTGTAFRTEEFNDPADGIEHLTGAGRRRLTALIAEAVREQLREPVR